MNRYKKGQIISFGADNLMYIINIQKNGRHVIFWLDYKTIVNNSVYYLETCEIVTEIFCEEECS